MPIRAADPSDAVQRQDLREKRRETAPGCLPLNPRRREPTPKDLADPRFDVIWNAIKRIDVDYENGLFSGATGNDVCGLLDSLDAVKADPDPAPRAGWQPTTGEEMNLTNQPTVGPWIWTQFSRADGAPIATVADVAETIAGSAHYSERAELFGVTLDDAASHEDGKATVVCYTGNGPNAHNNARAIAAMMTQGLDLLRRLVRERDHGFVYSADRRDAIALLNYIEGRESARANPLPDSPVREGATDHA
jgi:hypothetical protein